MSKATRGGSILHKRGRKQLNRAMHENVPILCRAEDMVPIRRATFEEVVESHSNSEGIVFAYSDKNSRTALRCKITRAK